MPSIELYHGEPIRQRNSDSETTTLVAMPQVFGDERDESDTSELEMRPFKVTARIEDDTNETPETPIRRLPREIEGWKFVNDTLRTLYGMNPNLYAHLWMTTFSEGGRDPELTLEIMQYYVHSAIATITLDREFSQEELSGLIVLQTPKRKDSIQ